MEIPRRYDSMTSEAQNSQLNTTTTNSGMETGFKLVQGAGASPRIANAIHTAQVGIVICGNSPTAVLCFDHESRNNMVEPKAKDE